LEQPLDPELADELYTSNLVPFGSVRSPLQIVGEVSFAAIAIVALTLTLYDRFAADRSVMAAAALTNSEDAVVVETPSAPTTTASVANVAYVVPASEVPAPTPVRAEPEPEPPVAPQQIVLQRPVEPQVMEPAPLPQQVQQVPQQRVGRILSPEEVDQLVRRAEAFLNQGDVAAARLFLERAAESRDPHAILMLGTTFDPDVLQRMGVVGIRPDREQAQVWYARAAEFGSREARQRLTALNVTAR
jgi:hypothetical protein